MARPLCTPIFRPRGTCASSPGAERSEALGKVVAQVKIFDRQHFGMAVYDVAHAARDRKGDLNVVVQRHIVDRVAERALKTWMDLVELAKAAGCG